MTIGAGFRCHDGVVLCSDTEETGTGFKRKVIKIEFRPVFWPASKDDPVAIFTGSGDSAFVDEVIDRMWNAAEDSGERELRKIVAVMTRENRKYHREIWEVYPPVYSIDQLPDADLLFAVWASDGFGLFSAASTRFKEITGVATIGCGGELAHYICTDAHTHGNRIQRCIPLAAHMLQQVKANIPGCGGESYIATLTETGAAGLLRRPEAEDMGKHLATGEQILKEVLIESADLTIEDREFRRSSGLSIRMLIKSRQELRKTKEKSRKRIVDLLKKFVKRGEGGTPMPSVSQR